MLRTQIAIGRRAREILGLCMALDQAAQWNAEPLVMIFYFYWTRLAKVDSVTGLDQAYNVQKASPSLPTLS